MAPSSDTIEIRLHEGLWASSMALEAVLLAWAEEDGAEVSEGARVAEVMIEGARHEICAPAAGRLAHEAKPLAVLEPGDAIGRIERRPS